MVLIARRETKESDIDSLDEVEQLYRTAIKIGNKKPPQKPLIYARVERNKVERF